MTLTPGNLIRWRRPKADSRWVTGVVLHEVHASPGWYLVRDAAGETHYVQVGTDAFQVELE